MLINWIISNAIPKHSMQVSQSPIFATQMQYPFLMTLWILLMLTTTFQCSWDLRWIVSQYLSICRCLNSIGASHQALLSRNLNHFWATEIPEDPTFIAFKFKFHHSSSVTTTTAAGDITFEIQNKLTEARFGRSDAQKNRFLFWELL